jgi:hypothetical protein
MREDTLSSRACPVQVAGDRAQRYPELGAPGRVLNPVPLGTLPACLVPPRSYFALPTSPGG